MASALPATGTASAVDASAAADAAAAPEDRVHAATAEARRDRAFIVSVVPSLSTRMEPNSRRWLPIAKLASDPGKLSMTKYEQACPAKSVLSS